MTQHMNQNCSIKTWQLRWLKVLWMKKCPPYPAKTAGRVKIISGIHKIAQPSNLSNTTYLICISFSFCILQPPPSLQSVVDPARIRCCHPHRLTNKTYSAIPKHREQNNRSSFTVSSFLSAEHRHNENDFDADDDKKVE